MIYVATCAGKHHEHSEDVVLIGREVLSETTDILSDPETGFVCVADGVGGNTGGAQASRFVLEALSEVDVLKPDDLRDFLTEVNEKLIDFASNTGDASGMATTLTGIYITGGVSYLVHVGNTRTYVKQGSYLKQVSSDHTTYNWLKSTGQQEAADSCNKNEITNCFGGGDRNLLSKLYISEIQPFSMMLLTSDGVHEYVDIDTLEDILFGQNITTEDKCQEILNRAIANGSEDDLSVVMICPSAAE